MVEFPAWFYSPDEDATPVLCETEADVPEGYLPHRERSAAKALPAGGRPKGKARKEPAAEPDDDFGDDY